MTELVGLLLRLNLPFLMQDYFDITFCYFPITFRPPPNDPYGISADNLKDSLQYVPAGYYYALYCLQTPVDCV